MQATRVLKLMENIADAVMDYVSHQDINEMNLRRNNIDIPEKSAVTFLNFDSLHALLTTSEYLDERRQIINSRIVGISTELLPVEPLSEPLAIRFEHFQAGKNPTCVFLDIVNVQGLYNPSGCQVFEHTEDYTVCQCSHLQRAFALLMEVREEEVCLGLTVLSHLSVLCTFYWLVPLCLQHYLDVLAPRAESPWWRYRILGWGPPVAVAAVTVGINYQAYLDLNGKCVLPVDDYLILAMTAPAGFAVLVATTVIIITVRVDHVISKTMKGAAFKKPRMEKIG
ncbi:PREDICTED: uncharacterized protein LOC109480151 [Branchiostoma belcheri]|uniref:Uncharacterized protein LOC109480151 n=1 Tax=Branchiostoma belcheri TaxID=7741 RepID=A0A6P4ZV00_BRABE|nr:PREDICTED: uncharacterized protein LOC109480151 [Branchiostoma belcheri]